jgi:hypothetical protein
MEERDLAVVWSGTLERNGDAPGLSAYDGPSPLERRMRDLNERRAHRETKPVQASWDEAERQLRGEPSRDVA